MNDRFVNVKVDREERPDLDAIYMQAVQALTGQGGWPMTVFLTPERRAVLRRNVLPAEPTAMGCRDFRGCCFRYRRLGRRSARILGVRSRR